ncbi:hypothetical protein AMATHDRAFT_77780 [Amanita thiersii Skay4041]|uniref:Major facilitator superfamily (MFS) profile domain-containing protein n=1 Tax=Amanita thiersii Skay4041 TaxID=703135 RepID=A0A2A9N777_9AGAR|nr:hypothetical protein AMATHDRAFT_77780 [Amanita thiersii Skay4041]
MVPLQHSNPPCPSLSSPPVVYRLYKQRFVGLVGLVFLNIISAMSWPWFGPISNNVSKELDITLDQVNWLGNIIACVYLPTTLLIPPVVSKYGISRCCQIGAVALILSAWIRYAGTSRTLSGSGAYALLIIGQLFAAIAQPIYQVLGPKYSETWFDLRGRTTATMIIAISNPIGGALGQLVSPLVGDTRKSILVLGILSTAVTPLVFLVSNAPPTPPTYAGSKPSPPLQSLLLAMIGKENMTSDAYMSPRSRVDFAIVMLLFGVLVAATNTFAILSAQILEPVGYSEDISGLMGACLLLTGIVAAIVTAPIFDRIFTHHLAITSKILVPILGGTWLSLIWAVKPNNMAGLFVIMTILGVCSITMLPIGLELGCDLTRNADGSSAILWFMGNLFGIMFVLVESALRAGPDAQPPLNMRRALIFNGTFVAVTASLVIFVRGKQERKQLDEDKIREVNMRPTQRTNNTVATHS